MARLIIFLVLIATGQLFAQSNSEEEVNVKQTINTFFEGFHKGDTLLMKSVLMNKVVLQTTFTNKEGKSQLVTDDISKMLTIIATKPDTQKWDERLLDYKIQVDDNMANVWIPYEFWFNGKFSHCGVNSFQLFSDNGKWKIIYLIDTRRRAGCLED